LNKVQNYFIVSLAASDFTVAALVMPLHLIKFLMRGRWVFPISICQVGYFFGTIGECRRG
jgi:hypothetical protein